MWRAAIYAREAPGRAGRVRLDRQVADLAALVARKACWQHVATYGDLDLGPAGGRPGLSRLLTEAPGLIDVVVVDGYGRLSANRAELDALLGHLGALGVQTVVLRPARGRRLARLVASLAVADLVGTAAR
jgi:DNA invertase Pin-like site-specific DNA recombinase